MVLVCAAYPFLVKHTTVQKKTQQYKEIKKGGTSILTYHLGPL